MAIDDKYIKNLTSKMDGYEWIHDIQKDWYIDAKDSVNNYWVAIITEDDQDKEEYNIHFDGWSTKYDEYVPYSCTKIEPFRTITKGYTGMKNSSKREEWSFKSEELESLKEKVEDIVKEEFDNFKTAFEATQFLRGEIYYYVDWILANWEEQNLSKSDFRKAIDFLEQVFLMIIKWLDLFPTKYMKYYELHKKYK